MPASARARRAKQRLAWALGLIVISQLLVATLFDYRWPLVRSGQLATLFGRLSRGPAPDIVFLGSSRMASDIVDKEAGECLERATRSRRKITTLNASVAAGDPVAEEHVLQQMLRVGVRPRLAVVEVGPEFCNWYCAAYQYNALRLLRWDHVPEHGWNTIRSGQGGRLAGARLVPVFQYRERLWEIASEWVKTGTLTNPITIEPQAFPEPLPRTPTNAPLNWSALLQMKGPTLSADLRQKMDEGAQFVRRSWLRQFRVSDVARRYLHRLLAHCAEHDIEVVLVFPPLTSYHRKVYTPEMEQRFAEFVAEFAGRPGVRYVDCRDWVPDEMFCDTHHLTPQGGVFFTRLFTQRILTALWSAG